MIVAIIPKRQANMSMYIYCSQVSKPQNFAGRKLWWIAVLIILQENIAGITTLHSKLARIKMFNG